jgi:hypothetical protein
MAVTFHQPSVYALFDAVPVPLMTFSVTGMVTYANFAAKRHPGHPVDAMSGNATVKALVGDATLGKLKLPYSAKIELENDVTLEGQFMPGPAGLDIAFIAHGDAASASANGSGQTPVRLKQIMGLLRDEMLPPLSLLDRQLQATPSPNRGIALASQTVHQRIMRLSDLVEVFGNEVLDANDRIDPYALIHAVCDELQTEASRLGVAFKTSPPPEDLPPIYGNSKLLYRALRECIDNALIHSRKEIQRKQNLTVDIKLTCTGEHVLISIRNQGASSVRVASQTPIRTISQNTAGEPAPRLGLPLVQRIVSLHGGQMRLGTPDQDSTQVLLEFPTGAPVRGQESMAVSQAQRYAEDLAKLISRRKKEPA